MPGASPSFVAHSDESDAGAAARVVRLVVEPVAQVGELRIEHRQKVFVRQAAPVVGVERLVAGGADAAFDLRGSSTPASTAGMQSASSTQLNAASNTSGATLRQRQIFAHHHSDE